MPLMDQQQPVPESKGTSTLQTLSRIGTVGVILAALYVGWVFYSRHLSDERATQDLAERQHAQQEKDVRQIFGSGEVKIISYSIDKASMSRGETADLCYGVLNTSKVVIEPHVEDSKPSNYHCLSVSPKTTTTYKITASNDKGESKSLAVTVHVN
jgi:hypothetical protein